MTRAEVKRCVGPLWRGGVRFLLDRGWLGWGSIWFFSSSRVFVEEAQKNGQLMLQLAYVAVVTRPSGLHVGVYERSVAGAHGQRQFKGLSVLNGESLSHPSLLGTERDELKTFCKNSGFDLRGEVKITRLGAGRTFVNTARSREEKEYLFAVRKVEVSMESLDGRIKPIDDLPAAPDDDAAAAAAPAGPPANKRGWTETDTLVGFFPAAGVLKAMEGFPKRKLMDECVLSALLKEDQACRRHNGASEARFRQRMPRGHPMSLMGRFMLWLERSFSTLLVSMPLVTLALAYVLARVLELGVDGALEALWRWMGVGGE